MSSVHSGPLQTNMSIDRHRLLWKSTSKLLVGTLVNKNVASNKPKPSFYQLAHRYNLQSQWRLKKKSSVHSVCSLFVYWVLLTPWSTITSILCYKFFKTTNISDNSPSTEVLLFSTGFVLHNCIIWKTNY